MAGISKYDMPSGSPDGSGYMIAQRGAYALEKSGNFREGAESRLVSSLPGTSRPGGGLSQADPGGMFQSLLSDLKPAGLEQKFPRAGEIKRTLNNIFGVSSEDSIPATAGMTLTLSAREEIRRMKSSLSECSMKARNRSKAFGEVVSKIDKYTHGLSRKRSRADISSGERPDMLLPGGAIPRTGTQSHLTASGLDNGAQNSEERSKSAVPSRRARTAREAGRIDARANGTARPSVAIDRDKDVFKHVNGATTPPEEKGRALSTGVDGWEKSKMKKKRSVIKSDASATASLDRPAEGDREPRQAMQQKLTSYARPRLNNTHGLSKSGRPPTKKWSERKGSTRPRQSMNNLPNEFTGEPDDDHGELLAAAKAAVDTGLACCSPFWKQIEPFLGFLSTEDLAFLNQQIHLTDDTAASNCVSDRNLKIDHGCISLPSTPTLASRDDCHTVSNGIWPDEREIDILLANQANHVEPFLEHLVRKNDAPNRISLCQTLISAIIDKEEVGSFGYVNGEGEHSFDCFEFDEELTPKVSHTNSLGTFQALERVPSNGYRTDGGGGGRYHGELMYQNLGNNDTSSEQNDEGHLFDELFPNQKMPCISMLSEFQYNQMSIDDRILLELNAIGIYPDPVPELEQEQSEEEEVGKSISILEEKLHEVVMKKRGLLTKLEKTAVEARTQQQSELERIALDKLVGTAYQKYMINQIVNVYLCTR